MRYERGAKRRGILGGERGADLAQWHVEPPQQTDRLRSVDLTERVEAIAGLVIDRSGNEQSELVVVT